MKARAPGLSLLAAALLACSSEGDATFTLHPGVELVTVTGARAGQALTLLDADDTVLLTLLADEAGQAHFAYLPAEPMTLQSGVDFSVTDGTTLKAGQDYLIRDETGASSERFDVLAVDDTPDPSLYERQTLRGVEVELISGVQPVVEEGFQYLEVRDGVKLSVMIRFPDADLYPPPWPTVVEYSGYSPSNPESPEPGSRIANLLGYATVGVNMRGTGCSGGVFDVFNPAQWADGYDVIETVARQKWVLHGKVGMVGLSYSGISQLFVGATRPPRLAALTPQSVIADPWEMQWPGGLYNSGFTKQWLGERDRQAEAGGMDWVARRAAASDTTCRDNLTLRSQNIDFEVFLHGLRYRPADALERSLPRLVSRIDVPVYLTGAWQDEQTGALFGDMLDGFSGLPREQLKVTLYNGRHPDGYSPLVLSRWFEFLELYVARRIPVLNGFVRVAAAPEFAREFGVDGLGFEPDRFADQGSYAAARAAYEAEPSVRVLFENGAGHTTPGAPVARFEHTYPVWPPPDALTRRWHLSDAGVLAATPPAQAGADRYAHDPEAGDTTFFGPRGYQLLTPLWDVAWSEFAEGDLVAYLTEPFATDTVLSGPGQARLFVKSDAAEAQVQVTLTEVRPDGVEYLVQSGWLDLGHRAVDTAASTERRVRRTYTRADYVPLPVGEWVEASVSVPSFAHAFRAGSRLRLSISTPGRNHGLWTFERPAQPAGLAIGRGPGRDSQLILGELPGLDVPADLPPCPALRGQACRSYRAVTNTPD